MIFRPAEFWKMPTVTALRVRFFHERRIDLRPFRIRTLTERNPLASVHVAGVVVVVFVPPAGAAPAQLTFTDCARATKTSLQAVSVPPCTTLRRQAVWSPVGWLDGFTCHWNFPSAGTRSVELRGSVIGESGGFAPSSSGRVSVMYVKVLVSFSVLPAGAVPWMIECV